MKTLAIAALSSLFLLTAACDDGAKKPAPGASAKATAASTAKPKPTTKVAEKKDDGAELDNEDIPVAADYEEKAEKEITEDNLEAKLAELEKELSEGT